MREDEATRYSYSIIGL